MKELRFFFISVVLGFGLVATALQGANITSITGVTLVPPNPLPGSSVTVNWNYTVDSAYNNPHVMIDVSTQCAFQPGNTSSQIFTIGDGCTGPSAEVTGGGCGIGSDVPSGSNSASETFTVPASLTPGETYYVAVGMQDYNVYASPSLSVQEQSCTSFMVPLPAPFITLSKVAEGSSAEPGGEVLYTIYYDFGNVTNVAITDVVSSNLNIVAVYNGGSAVGQTLTWNFSGYTATPVSGFVSFMATVGGSVANNTIISNQASASASGGVTASSNNAAVTVGEVGLTIAKSVTPSTAVMGNTLTYTMNYATSGESLDEFQNFDAPTIPAGFVQFANPGDGTWDTTNGYLEETAVNANNYPGLMDTTMTTVHDAVYIYDTQISSADVNYWDSIFRFNSDAGVNNFYMMDFESDSGGTFRVLKQPGGTVICPNVSTPNGLTIENDTWYTVKIQVVCNTISAKVWLRGTTEPTAWATTGTDAAPGVLAGPGMVGFQEDGGPVLFDNLKVFSLQAGTNVRVWDTIPAGTTYVAGSCVSCSQAGNVLTWPLSSTCGNEGSVSFQVTVNGPAGCGSITNTAIIWSDDPPPQVPSNTVSTSLGSSCSSPTPSATLTDTLTASPTRTATPSATPSNSATPTSSPSATRTNSPSPTPTFSATLTSTATPSPSASASSSPTFTESSTLTNSPTPSDSASPSPSFTGTMSFSATKTPTLSASPTPTVTPSDTFSASATPSVTASVTSSATQSNTFTDTPTPTATASATLSATQSNTFTDTATPSATASATSSATQSNTFTDTTTPTPSVTFSSTRTNSPTKTGSPTPSPSLTATKTVTVSPTWSPSPTITMTFTPSPPFHVDIDVYNSAGEEVAVINDAQGLYSTVTSTQALISNFDPDQGGVAEIMLLGPHQIVSWDGHSSSGQTVASGIYSVKVQITDPFGRVSAYTTQVSVLRSGGPLEVEIFNSAGELVRSIPVPGGVQPVGLKTLPATLVPGPTAAPVVISLGAGSSVSWNGTNSRGQIVSPGVYEIKVGSSSDLSYGGTVTVLAAPGTDHLLIQFADNPHRGASGPLRIKVSGISVNSSVEAGLYNYAGERVDGATLSGGGWINFTRNIASGVYLVEVSVLDQGQVLHSVNKVAVIR